MTKNNNLHSAKKAKNDEFYTRIEDIENELKHYKDFFKGKVVFCNCGDAIHHNFGKYFSMNFEHLGLKKLICTSFEMDGSHGKVAIYEGDKNGNYIPDSDEWTTYVLEGNGDFRSAECIELLKESDVVVTNPPFSLFREYIAQLMKYGKKFLIIGNQNAITYKEIFPYIKENKLWLGVSISSGDREFRIPDNYVVRSKSLRIDENGNKYVRVVGVRWFTNIPHDKRNAPLNLCKKYSEVEYPKYDNYDAINVNKTIDIPMDYDGVMGVPITFLDKYCPTQFEILGIANNVRWIGDFPCLTIIKGEKVYNRILIRRKKQFGTEIAIDKILVWVH